MLPDSTASSFISRLRTPKPAPSNIAAFTSFRETREQFCDLYGPQIRVWALTRLMLQPSDADDFTQDVLIVALEKIHQYKEKNSFRGWLWTILKNQVGMWHRRQRDRPQGAGGTTFYEIIQSLQDVAPESEIRTTDVDEARLIVLLIEHGCDQKEVTLRAFIHYCLLNRNPHVVAKDLGISVSSVYQAKTRVTKSLRGGLPE